MSEGGFLVFMGVLLLLVIIAVVIAVVSAVTVQRQRLWMMMTRKNRENVEDGVSEMVLHFIV